MSLIPYLDSTKKIVDGTYIKALNFCKENCQKERCQKFYDTLLQSSNNGFYKCPYGLSVYLKKINDEKRVFVSFREQNTYVKKNKRFLKGEPEAVFFPLFL